MSDTILTVGSVMCCDGAFKVGPVTSPFGGALIADCPCCGQRYEICPLPVVNPEIPKHP